jgi:hypothetical protein
MRTPEFVLYGCRGRLQLKDTARSNTTSEYPWICFRQNRHCDQVAVPNILLFPGCRRRLG